MSAPSRGLRRITQEEADRRLRIRAERYFTRTPNACWPWTGTTDGHGYGAIGVRSDDLTWRSRKAHRVVYELLVGPIPEGLQLDHLCRNRACVNPDHLEPVTNRENSLRGFGAAAMNARKATCPRGHVLAGRNLVQCRAKNGSRECRICANELTRIRNAGGGEHACECGLAFPTSRSLMVHRGKLHGNGIRQQARAFMAEAREFTSPDVAAAVGREIKQANAEIGAARSAGLVEMVGYRSPDNGLGGRVHVWRWAA